MAKQILILFVLSISLLVNTVSAHNIIQTSAAFDQLTLKKFHETETSVYFISETETDSITASETCKLHSKSLISIETEQEFNDIVGLISLNEIPSIWTSGVQTITNASTRYIWNNNRHSGAQVMEKYINEENNSKHHHRAVREVNHPPHYPILNPNPIDCNCNAYCPERPKCSTVECNITIPECNLVDRVCDIISDSECSMLEEPNCTVTCPQCTITRGQCTVTRPPCTVVPGKCETKRDNCEIIKPPCQVVKGKCEVIKESCEVQSPTSTCPNLPVSANKTDGTCPIGYKSEKQINLDCTNCPSCPKPCTGSNCTINPTPPIHHNSTSDPCKYCCGLEYHCVPDVVCKPPPVICSIPIVNCLPGEVICPQPEVVCNGQVTVCEPPQVTCPDIIKHCTSDTIVCPAPQTICTPAVSHCTAPNVTCTSAALHCPKPIVTCPELPECVVPSECYNPNPDCNCNGKDKKRSKRSIGGEEPTTGVFYENDEVLDINCVGIENGGRNKNNGLVRVGVDKCDKKKLFVCEERKGY